MSRLECLQAAVDWHIVRLMIEHPNKRVSVVLFSSEVTLCGDCTGEPKVLAGDKLNDYDAVINAGVGLKIETLKPIKDSSVALRKKISELTEGGSTALGPALVACLGIAQGKRGSEVIVCTDGVSNVGLGSLDTPEQRKSAETFWQSLASEAARREVKISVLGIENPEGGCALSFLGKVSDATKGTCNVLPALELLTQIVRISQQPTVALETKVKLLAPAGFVWAGTDNNSLAVEVGNVTVESGLTFSLTARKGSKAPVASSGLVQAQIEFSLRDGTRLLRTCTLQTKSAPSRDDVLKTLNVSVVGLHVLHQAAVLALKGDKEKVRARESLFAAQRVLSTLKREDQREEAANYLRLAEELDSTLRTNSSSDAVAKVLFRMRGVGINEVLAGAKKKDAVARRVAMGQNEKLSEMYYNYRF